MSTLWTFPVWDEMEPFDTMPVWAAQAINASRLAKIPTEIMLRAASQIVLNCPKCAPVEFPIFGSVSITPESTIEHCWVTLRRDNIAWGDSDGTSQLCGFVWSGECLKCGTRYATFRNATTGEREKWGNGRFWGD